MVELFERLWFGLLHLLEGGPFEQEVSGQRPPQFVAAQRQRLGIILFEQGLQAVGEAGALIHHGPAMADELLEQARLGILGHPDLELGVMGEEQLSQVVGILGVVLGATGDEGLAILLEGDGIDGVKG